MRRLAIIEFPSNLGLKMPYENHEPGVKKLPDHLKKYGFHNSINPSFVSTLQPPSYKNIVDIHTGVRNSDEIVSYALQQESVLSNIISEKLLPIVIGGDCSILLGNTMALKKLGKYGLFFLDGHTDFMMPKDSKTSGAAGMDLALVTGYGSEILTNMNNLKPYINEKNVWCVGNREYDKDYVQPILESKIKYYDLFTLRKIGFKNCSSAFLDNVNRKNLDGFWIHIDVDVLNDEIMPAVDSRNEDGLSYPEFIEILKPLLKSEKLTGIQITILDPENDSEGVYSKEFISVFTELVNYIT